ncbi:hypothetical protein GJ744_004908 [Endocarpon pusillum]|uniref:Uncharacterized protein n=1 Tax=Endocarpon pusillum TaxID=364733 RepID=A0A8H7ALJ0_9EURO|nr:hypothetical protein GJ744_004908 [Endocarpon pusillum]
MSWGNDRTRLLLHMTHLVQSVQQTITPGSPYQGQLPSGSLNQQPKMPRAIISRQRPKSLNTVEYNILCNKQVDEFEFVKHASDTNNLLGLH